MGENSWKLIWEIAGLVGVDPGPLTLRELFWMAEARSRDNWAHTSSLLAMLANVNRDPKKCRAFKPEDFDPHERRKKTFVVKNEGIGILRKVFIDGPRRAKKEV